MPSKVSAFLGIVLLIAVGGCNSDTAGRSDGGKTGDQSAAHLEAGRIADIGQPSEQGTKPQDLGTQPQDQKATRDQKVQVPDQGAGSCTQCHGQPPTTGQHTVSGHKSHTCSTCHNKVVDDKNAIISTTLHKNGTKDVSGSFTWTSSSKQCSNVPCHAGTMTW